VQVPKTVIVLLVLTAKLLKLELVWKPLLNVKMVNFLTQPKTFVSKTKHPVLKDGGGIQTEKKLELVSKTLMVP